MKVKNSRTTFFPALKKKKINLELIEYTLGHRAIAQGTWCDLCLNSPQPQSVQTAASHLQSKGCA